MSNLIVDMVVNEEQVIYGLWKKSNDRSVSADIKALSGQYYETSAFPRGSVLPFFVLSKDYDEKTRDFALFIGGAAEKASLERLVLPAGNYAKITIRPKLGFLWGAAIGEAKRYLYTKWLPASGYQGLNMEYEFHTEKSEGKQGTIDLIFAIEPKG